MRRLGMRKVLFIPLLITVIVAQTVDYDTDIQPLWDGNCTSCHVYGHSSGLNLTSGQSYNNLVDVASSGNGYGGALRVASGDPENSVLYDKITNGGTYGGGVPGGSSFNIPEDATLCIVFGVFT